MEASRAAGFSHQDQIHLLEATIIFQVHTVHDIMTLDGIKTKNITNDGHIDD